MKPSIFQVEIDPPGKIYVMPKPSGEWIKEDLAEIRSMGITDLISLLCDDEIMELGLSSEAEICANLGIRYRTQFQIVACQRSLHFRS